jgi:hypothetical protein
MIPRARDVLNGVGGGGLTRSGGKGGNAVFQRGDALFKNIPRGIHNSCIDISRLGQREAIGG